MDELGSDFLFPQGTNLSGSFDESDFNETTLLFTSTDKIDQFYDDRYGKLFFISLCQSVRPSIYWKMCFSRLILKRDG